MLAIGFANEIRLHSLTDYQPEPALLTVIRPALHTRLQRAGLLALVLVAIWSQVANAHHLVDHALTEPDEQNHCEFGHAPVAAEAGNTGLHPSLPAARRAHTHYTSPFIAAHAFQLADIRAPPGLTWA